MSIDNILSIIQITILVLGSLFYYLHIHKTKNPKPVIKIEDLPPNITKGFGYVKGKSIVLNEDGVPYLYETFLEAQKNMKKLKGVNKIIYQQWDLESQTVLVGEVKNGSNK